MKFHGLNYTSANEDSSLEYGILTEEQNHVFTIAGSGSRVIPLLARAPKYLTCIDLSKEQIYLTKLRIESIRHFSYPEFLFFWGYSSENDNPEHRQNLFFQISTLDSETRTYCQNLLQFNEWKSLIDIGKWEKNFFKFSKMARFFVGNNNKEFFLSKTLEDQKDYLKNSFPSLSWNAFLFLYSSLLEIAWRIKPSSFPNRNMSQSFLELYQSSFDRLFNNVLAKDSFLTQRIFLGKMLYEEGYPIEASSIIFESAKLALKKTEVRYIQGDVIEGIKTVGEKLNFISFSNAPSYFSPNQSKSYCQELLPYVANNGLIVVRSFMNLIDGINIAGYKNVSNQFQELIQQERVQFYDVQVYRRTA